jgi:hypothetical protein
MTLFKNIQVFEPYFHSIRKHQTFLIIDVKLPNDWEYKTVTQEVAEQIGVKENGVKEGFKFVSFFSKQNEEEVELSVSTIKKVIDTNLEREEKERLLQQKIIELQRQFEVSSLDDLKSLSISFSEPTITKEENGQVETIGMVEEGNQER